jgi:hypothetical protein
VICGGSLRKFQSQPRAAARVICIGRISPAVKLPPPPFVAPPRFGMGSTRSGPSKRLRSASRCGPKPFSIPEASRFVAFGNTTAKSSQSSSMPVTNNCNINAVISLEIDTCWCGEIDSPADWPVRFVTLGREHTLSNNVLVACRICGGRTRT